MAVPVVFGSQNALVEDDLDSQPDDSALASQITKPLSPRNTLKRPHGHIDNSLGRESSSQRASKRAQTDALMKLLNDPSQTINDNSASVKGRPQQDQSLDPGLQTRRGAVAIRIRSQSAQASPWRSQAMPASSTRLGSSARMNGNRHQDPSLLQPDERDRADNTERSHQISRKTNELNQELVVSQFELFSELCKSRSFHEALFELRKCNPAEMRAILQRTDQQDVQAVLACFRVQRRVVRLRSRQELEVTIAQRSSPPHQPCPVEDIPPSSPPLPREHARLSTEEVEEDEEPETASLPQPAKSPQAPQSSQSSRSATPIPEWSSSQPRDDEFVREAPMVGHEDRPDDSSDLEIVEPKVYTGKSHRPPGPLVAPDAGQNELVSFQQQQPILETPHPGVKLGSRSSRGSSTVFPHESPNLLVPRTAETAKVQPIREKDGPENIDSPSRHTSERSLEQERRLSAAPDNSQAEETTGGPVHEETTFACDRGFPSSPRRTPASQAELTESPGTMFHEHRRKWFKAHAGIAVDVTSAPHSSSPLRPAQGCSALGKTAQAMDVDDTGVSVNPPTIFDTFRATYPDYEGSAHDFKQLCTLLRSSGNALHKTLWDDSVVVIAQHRLENIANASSDPLDYYYKNVNDPKHHRRVLNPSTLDEAADLAIHELSTQCSQEEGHPQQSGSSASLQFREEKPLQQHVSPAPFQASAATPTLSVHVSPSPKHSQSIPAATPYSPSPISFPIPDNESAMAQSIRHHNRASPMQPKSHRSIPSPTYDGTDRGQPATAQPSPGIVRQSQQSSSTHEVNLVQQPPSQPESQASKSSLDTKNMTSAQRRMSPATAQPQSQQGPAHDSESQASSAEQRPAPPSQSPRRVLPWTKPGASPSPAQDHGHRLSRSQPSPASRLQHSHVIGPPPSSATQSSSNTSSHIQPVAQSQAPTHPQPQSQPKSQQQPSQSKAHSLPTTSTPSTFSSFEATLERPGPSSAELRMRASIAASASATASTIAMGKGHALPGQLEQPVQDVDLTLDGLRGSRSSGSGGATAATAAGKGATGTTVTDIKAKARVLTGSNSTTKSERQRRKRKLLTGPKLVGFASGLRDPAVKPAETMEEAMARWAEGYKALKAHGGSLVTDVSEEPVVDVFAWRL